MKKSSQFEDPNNI